MDICDENRYRVVRSGVGLGTGIEMIESKNDPDPGPRPPNNCCPTIIVDTGESMRPEPLQDKKIGKTFDQPVNWIGCIPHQIDPGYMVNTIPIAALVPNSFYKLL